MVRIGVNDGISLFVLESNEFSLSLQKKKRFENDENKI
jgi:hypothetical protein